MDHSVGEGEREKGGVFPAKLGVLATAVSVKRLGPVRIGRGEINFFGSTADSITFSRFAVQDRNLVQFK